MAERSNHHFVPQFYFRRFSQDGRSICLLHRKTGRIVSTAPIKSQASRHQFYGTTEFETALGELEGVCALALKELSNAHHPALLSPEQVSHILLWLTLQRSRTWTSRIASQPLHDKMVQLLVEAALHHDQELDSEIKQCLLDNIESVGAEPVGMQLMEMKHALEGSHEIADLSPVLLRNRTSRPFLFGDAPVVFYNAHLRGVTLRGVLGLTTPGLMIYFPLDPKNALLMLDSERYQVSRAVENQVFIRKLDDVMALNKCQLHAASECLYFHDPKLASYVTELWAQERRQLSDHRPQIVQAPGISSETGEELGEIVHTFHPQIPYHLELSFLAHDTLDDRTYRFARRGAGHI